MSCAVFAYLSAGAVHCCYEIRRRLFNDSQPQCRKKAKDVMHVSNKHKLQRQVSNMRDFHYYDKTHV